VTKTWKLLDAGRARLAASSVLLLAGASVAATRVDLNGGLYPQFKFDGQRSEFMVMGAEGDITARISGKTRDIATGVIQLWAMGMTPDWTMGFHFGEAYVMIPTGLRLPIIKFGQAVIPFGLLADYDTHTQIVQTLYARSLGLRLDPGIGFQGQLGKTDYALWLSNGSGPYPEDKDWNKVLTVRVAPKFLLGDAEVTLGASGLAGVMPYWRVDSMMNMMSGPQSYRMKYRAALDNTTDWGAATFHLEGVVGKDSTWSGPLAYGYYAEGRYAFIDWLEALVKYDGFHVAAQGVDRTVGAGFTFYPRNLSSLNLQVIFGKEWIETMDMNEGSWNVTTQLTFTF
jgi:hypothetical protein